MKCNIEGNIVIVENASIESQLALGQRVYDEWPSEKFT